MYRRVLPVICLVLSLTLPLSANKYDVDIGTDELMVIAEKGLHQYLNIIQSQQRYRLGLDGSSNDFNAKLGKPFSVYVVRPDCFLNSDFKNSYSYFYKLHVFYYPILLNGVSRCILEVAYFQGEWQAVGIGKAIIARELETILNKRAISGNCKYVRVLQSNSAFVLTESDHSKVIPLHTTAFSLGLTTLDQKSYTYPEVNIDTLMRMIAPLVIQNIEFYRLQHEDE